MLWLSSGMVYATWERATYLGKVATFFWVFDAVADHVLARHQADRNCLARNRGSSGHSSGTVLESFPMRAMKGCIAESAESAPSTEQERRALITAPAAAALRLNLEIVTTAKRSLTPLTMAATNCWSEQRTAPSPASLPDID